MIIMSIVSTFVEYVNLRCYELFCRSSLVNLKINFKNNRSLIIYEERAKCSHIYTNKYVANLISLANWISLSIFKTIIQLKLYTL